MTRENPRFHATAEGDVQFTEEEEIERDAEEAAALIPKVPLSASPRQIRQAMTIKGLRGSVEAVIAQADQDTKDWYQYSTEFLRDHMKVAAVAAVLHVSETQLDDLWILANSL